MSDETMATECEVPAETRAPEIVTFFQPWFRRKLFLSDQPYFLQKSREEGERELLKLARSLQTREEGGWLFSAEYERWYNLREEACTVFCPDISREIYSYCTRAVDFSSCGAWVSDYHIHPYRAQALFLQRDFQRLEQDASFLALPKERQQIVQTVKTNYATVQTALPSDGDIGSWQQDFERHSPNCALDFRVVSSAGMTIMHFAPQAARENVEHLAAKYLKFYRKALPSAIQEQFCSTEQRAVHAAVGAVNHVFHSFFKLEFRSAEELA